MHRDILPYATNEIARALSQYFASRTGGPAPTNPCAEDMLQGHFSIARIAKNFVTGTDGEAPADTIARALGTSDFGLAISEAFNALAVARFDETAAGYRRLLAPTPLPDFRPARIPTLSLGDFARVPEFAEWQFVDVSSRDPLDEQSLETHGGGFMLTRQALANDDVAQIPSGARQLGDAAARAVGRGVAEVLEDSSNLDDASPLFHADHGNLITPAAAPSVASFDLMVRALWRQSTPAGATAGIAARYVVVPPELEITARTLLLAVYGTASTVEVIVLPFLTSTTAWYVIGDPSKAPAIGYGTLDGGRGFFTERARTPFERDGVAIRARVDFRILRLSRIGIVRNAGA